MQLHSGGGACFFFSSFVLAFIFLVSFYFPVFPFPSVSVSSFTSLLFTSTSTSLLRLLLLFHLHLRTAIILASALWSPRYLHRFIHSSGLSPGEQQNKTHDVIFLQLKTLGRRGTWGKGRKGVGDLVKREGKLRGKTRMRR